MDLFVIGVILAVVAGNLLITILKSLETMREKCRKKKQVKDLKETEKRTDKTLEEQSVI